MAGAFYPSQQSIKLYCAYGEGLGVEDAAANEKDEMSRKLIHVWELKGEGAEKIGAWKGHDGAITSMVLSRQHMNRLFSGSQDKGIIVWDIFVSPTVQFSFIDLIFRMVKPFKFCELKKRMRVA